jgi:dihydrofolate reductase
MITALFAVDNTGGMGFQGSMPWPRIKEDMVWFKKTTQNNTVVMGKNTWTSTDMPTPLPGRTNVVITNNFMDRDDIIQLRGDICTGLMNLQENHNMENIFIIGGPNILVQALPIIDRAFITRIQGEYTNDTFINLDSFLKDFKLVDTKNFNTCIIEEYEK